MSLSSLWVVSVEPKSLVSRRIAVGALRGSQQEYTVGIRADMDALPIKELTNVPFKSLNPGVMHACGHDIHTSIALGTAIVLSSLKDEIKESIK